MDRKQSRKKTDEQIILDCISDGVVTIGQDMKIKYMNKAMQNLLGYELEEVLESGLDCHLFVQSNICTTHDCIMEKALCNREKVSNYETAIRNKEGRVIPVSINTDFLWDAVGNFIGVVETFRDLSQIKELKDKLEEKEGRRGFANIIGKSKKLQEILDLLPAVANSKSTVLLEGESGTGKELIARVIHAYSPRKDKPFIALNCAALAEGVLESELFGHVKGAFTGAHVDRKGRFEIADKGTIFLDEIGDMNLSTQVKLLRVLQEEEIELVGGNKSIELNVRVIAATNKDLALAVKNGTFREDLYYRIRVFPITIPPLRERKDDILPLIEHFIAKFNSATGKSINNFSSKALDALLAYDFPGNVRELENIIEHAFVRCSGKTILIEHLPKDIIEYKKEMLGGDLEMLGEDLEKKGSLKAIERELIGKTLENSGWKYQETAEKLGISRSTLYRKIKEFGIGKSNIVSE